MSKVVFVKCANKECKNRSYPVDAGNEEILKLCPECDSKSHKLIKLAKQQAQIISNEPKGQSMDAGKVEKIDAGINALNADGISLENQADGLGVEVESVSETPNEVALPAGLKVPVITAAEAKKQASAKRKGKGKK